MEETKKSVMKDKSVAALIFEITCCVILIAYTLSLLVTFGWGVMTSFKTTEAYELDKIAFPKGENFTIEHYVNVFSAISVPIAGGAKINFFGMLMNSVLYAVGSALLQTLACCIVAYAVARFDNSVSKVLYGIVIVCMALPIVGQLPSQLQLMMDLNLHDTMFGSWFFSASFLGMHFLVFHATFKAIPKDFSEAAMLDGAGRWRIFLTIMLPLVKLSFWTVFLLKFMVFWNDYQSPLIFMPNLPVLSYGVFQMYKGYAKLTTEYGVETFNKIPHVMAGSMMVFVPMLVLFMATHKRLIGNVSMGGIKG